MTIKELREKKGLTRKEVAKLSGINLRSLQDYEQGHKDITHAKGETLYLLSLALGCTMEELMEGCRNVIWEEDSIKEGRLKCCRISLPLTKTYLEGYEIFCQTYKIYAKWAFEGEQCSLVFPYQGKVIHLPLRAEFTEQTLPWLVKVAVMMIENYVEHAMFQERFSDLGGSLWDEE